KKMSDEEVKKGSELKTAEQIKEFLTENIKEDEKAEFVKHLSELSEVEQPTGNTEEEKANNFLTTKKAEVVIKTIFNYKLKKDDSFQNEIQAEMETKKDNNEQKLDEKVYPKENGKYTREAMARYLYEKKTVQSHQFSAKSSDSQNSPSSRGSH
ncbi:11460_t:CDS:2, partial [Ambispora gerdemannii]